MTFKEVEEVILNAGGALRTVEIAERAATSVKSAQKGVSEGLLLGELLEIRNPTDRRYKSYKVKG